MLTIRFQRILVSNLRQLVDDQMARFYLEHSLLELVSLLLETEFLLCAGYANQYRGRPGTAWLK